MHRSTAILTGTIVFAVAIGSAQQPSNGGPYKVLKRANVNALQMPQTTVVITSRPPAKIKRVCRRRMLIGDFPHYANLAALPKRSGKSIALALALECRWIDPQDLRCRLERRSSGDNARDVLPLDLLDGAIFAEH